MARVDQHLSSPCRVPCQCSCTLPWWLRCRATGARRADPYVSKAVLLSHESRGSVGFGHHCIHRPVITDTRPIKRDGVEKYEMFGSIPRSPLKHQTGGGSRASPEMQRSPHVRDGDKTWPAGGIDDLGKLSLNSTKPFLSLFQQSAAARSRRWSSPNKRVRGRHLAIRANPNMCRGGQYLTSSPDVMI